MKRRSTMGVRLKEAFHDGGKIERSTMGVRSKEAFYDGSTIETGVLRWGYDRSRRSTMEV